ncbi:hypothetical protein BDB13_5839 [Rhodococcus sp. OK302]|nr:hypothetical protein BDB13_5839 [Rhodococcus sp. OK302]
MSDDPQQNLPTDTDLDALNRANRSAGSLFSNGASAFRRRLLPGPEKRRICFATQR